MSENVYLFVPNLIGYVRITLALTSFWFMSSDDSIKAVVCYMLNVFLDELDGYAARRFGQETKFGAMLDMLTDRCANMGLLVVLSILYPNYVMIFQMIMFLDVSSHWLYMHSTVLTGSRSHKAVDLSCNPLLRLYYTSWTFLFVMCVGNELFYCTLYLLKFSCGPPLLFGIGLWKVVCALTLPIALLKSGISAIHLYTATENIVALDLAEREGRVKSN